MIKKVVLTLFLLCGFTVLGQVNYIQITYNIAPYPNNQYPARVKAFATLEYDAYLNPAHLKMPVAGTYNSSTGQIQWTMPAGCYVRFVCEETKLNKLIKIPEANAVLNNLLPADPPPAPPWATFFKTINVPEGSNVSATTYWDILKLKAGEGIKIEGNATSKEITITNTKPDVSINGGGIVEVSGSYPNFTISATEHQGLDNVLAIGNTTDKDIITSGTIFTKEFKLDKSFQENDILRVNNNGYLFYDKEFVHYLIDLSQATSLLTKQIAISKPNDYICELKLGLEYPKGNNIAGYRFILGAEDNGIYGYSGAIVFENALENEVEMFLMGDTFKLRLNTNSYSTNYYFTGDNFYMETNNNSYEFYHTGNDANLAKKDSVNEFEANQFATKFIETTKYKADNPRPYGYPQTNPNSLDNEFEGEDLSNYHWYSASKNPSNGQEENPPLVVSQSIYPSYLYISNDGVYTNKYFVKEIQATTDMILVAKIEPPSQGNMLGIVILDASGSGCGFGITYSGTAPFYTRLSITNWGISNTGNIPTLQAKEMYLMIRKRENNISMAYSANGIIWNTVQQEGVYYMNNDIKYIGFIPSLSNYIPYPKPSAFAIDFLRVE